MLFGIVNMKTPWISECKVFTLGLLVFNGSPLQIFTKFPNGLTFPKDVVSLIFWSLLSIGLFDSWIPEEDCKACKVLSHSFPNNLNIIGWNWASVNLSLVNAWRLALFELSVLSNCAKAKVFSTRLDEKVLPTSKVTSWQWPYFARYYS